MQNYPDEIITVLGPILAPGKKLSEMSRRITRFGGTIFPTRFIVYMNWAMGSGALAAEKGRDYAAWAREAPRVPQLKEAGTAGAGTP